MISDEDRASLADLVLRAIDTILEDYGDEAELMAACLVFEVRVPDEEDPETGPLYHGNYKSLPGNSPHHIAGLLTTTARHVSS